MPDHTRPREPTAERSRNALKRPGASLRRGAPVRLAVPPALAVLLNLDARTHRALAADLHRRRLQRQYYGCETHFSETEVYRMKRDAREGELCLTEDKQEILAAELLERRRARGRLMEALRCMAE